MACTPPERRYAYEVVTSPRGRLKVGGHLEVIERAVVERAGPDIDQDWRRRPAPVPYALRRGAAPKQASQQVGPARRGSALRGAAAARLLLGPAQVLRIECTCHDSPPTRWHPRAGCARRGRRSETGAHRPPAGRYGSGTSHRSPLHNLIRTQSLPSEYFSAGGGGIRLTVPASSPLTATEGVLLRGPPLPMAAVVLPATETRGAPRPCQPRRALQSAAVWRRQREQRLFSVASAASGPWPTRTTSESSPLTTSYLTPRASRSPRRRPPSSPSPPAAAPSPTSGPASHSHQAAPPRPGRRRAATGTRGCCPMAEGQRV